jgi:prepilin-type N-terminal cleavage/methylation domain-containing protein
MTRSDPMSQRGFTIIEVLISLAILIIAITILSSTVIGSARHDKNSGHKTQAVEFLNYLGRYAVEGNSKVIPAITDTEKIFNYGDIASAFPDIINQGGFSDPNLYKGKVTRVGTVSLSSASATQYNIEVCWKDKAGEACVTAITLGPDTQGRSLSN